MSCWKSHFENKGQIKCKAGASIVEFKPVFSFDSRFLIVPCGDALKVFSTQTGDCVNKLQSYGKRIVAVQQNPKNQIQVISCSENGIVIFWDYQDATILKKFKIKLEVLTSVVTFNVLSTANQWTVLVKKKKDCAASLMKVTQNGSTVTNQLIFKTVQNIPNAVAVGKKGEFVASIYESNLNVYCFSTSIHKLHKISEQQHLHCVTCHSNEDTVAAGDSLGRIFIWWNVFDSSIPPRTLYHWHTLPVADLAFTVEGSHLYSGGGECVLVKWKVGSDHRNFVARMGLPIRYIVTSNDNQLTATSHLDNAIQLINSQNNVAQICQGLAVNFQLINNVPVPVPIHTGLLCDPRSKALVLNGRPGHLQFYSLEEDRLLFHLDIVNQNYLTQERNQTIVNTEVEKAAFDDTGLWLATVECRDDGYTSLEISLKFWRFDEIKQKYELNTAVLLPHNKKLKDIKFRPQFSQGRDYSPLAVTAGGDKKFKIWVLQDESDEYGKKDGWACESLGYYQNLEPGCMSFSEDGSLLAVSFHCQATLWKPDTTNLQGVLYHPKCQSVIKQAQFGRLSCSHLLVCCTDEGIAVWNLLTLTLIWSVDTPVMCFAADTLSEYMVVFSNEQWPKLYVFKPDSPEIIYNHEVRPPSRVQNAIFIPNQSVSSTFDDSSCLAWQKQSQLYFLNEKQELFTICDNKMVENEEKKMTIKEMHPLTPYGMILAKHKKTDTETATIEQHMVQGILGIKEVEELLNVPSHVLPSISVLCSNFLSSMLVSNEQDKIKNEGNENQEESDDASEEMTDDDMQVDNIDNTDSVNVINKTDPTESAAILESSEKKIIDRLEIIQLEDYSFLANSAT